MKLKKIAVLFVLNFFITTQAKAFEISPYVKENAVKIDNLSEFNNELFEKLKGYKFITLGEIHGGQESTIIAFSLAKLLLKNGKKVVLGIEVPEKEQKNIDEYYKTGNENPIINSDFFNRKSQDGRSSKAMFELIKKCRNVKNLKLLCFDIDIMDEGGDRDKLMAENIVNLVKNNTEYSFITLSGNMHAGLKQVKIENGTHNPMGYYLHTLPESHLKYDDILSLNHNFMQGNAWNCVGTECKRNDYQPFHGKYIDSVNYENYFLIKENSDNGYKGIIFTRKMNISYPLNYNK